jgi:hypothetical protein
MKNLLWFFAFCILLSCDISIGTKTASAQTGPASPQYKEEYKDGMTFGVWYYYSTSGNNGSAAAVSVRNLTLDKEQIDYYKRAK